MSAPKNMPLPAFASPQRRQAIEALAAAGKPLTTVELALAAALPLQTVRNIMCRMAGSSQGVRNVGTASLALWALVEADESKPAKPAAPRRHCNSNTPPLSVAPRMTCDRPGAQDHLAVPSRRADVLADHRPPLIIGSYIPGGMR